LRSGLPYEVQPKFSPDGKQISFTSEPVAVTIFG
jgi:hypothetical protein